jgi:hypothetical protein
MSSGDLVHGDRLGVHTIPLLCGDWPEAMDVHPINGRGYHENM